MVVMVSVDRCILNKDIRLVQPERLVDTTYQGNIVAGRTTFVVESSLVLLAWHTQLSKDSGQRYLSNHYNDQSA